MTVVAVIAGCDVPGRFASGASAVVTRTAVAGHSHVVHVEDRAPGRSCVAAVAGFRGGDVAGRLHRR